MAELRGTTCCGLKEFSGVSSFNNAEESVKFIAKQRWHNSVNMAFVLFTDKGFMSAGSRLANYIENQGLGTVTKSPPKKNPNSGNRLQIWVWAIDWSRLETWWNKTVPETERIPPCYYCKKSKQTCGCCQDCGNNAEEDCTCDICEWCEGDRNECYCCSTCETTADNCECCAICGEYRGTCGCCVQCERSDGNCTCCSECEATEEDCKCPKEEPLSTTPTI